MNDSTTARAPHIEATIARAVAKVHEQARAGNLPALLSSEVAPDGTRQTWTITSRTVAGTVYVVELLADCRGVDTHCQCEAQHANRICWHRCAARAALFGDIAYHDARGWQHAGPDDLADLLTYWKQPAPVADPFDAADWTVAA